MSFHVSVARPFAFACTAVPVNVPVAPTFTPVGFGTSELALRVEVSLYDVACGAASVSPAKSHDDRERGGDEEW